MVGAFCTWTMKGSTAETYQIYWSRRDYVNKWWRDVGKKLNEKLSGENISYLLDTVLANVKLTAYLLRRPISPVYDIVRKHILLENFNLLWRKTNCTRLGMGPIQWICHFIPIASRACVILCIIEWHDAGISHNAGNTHGVTFTM